MAKIITMAVFSIFPLQYCLLWGISFYTQIKMSTDDFAMYSHFMNYLIHNNIFKKKNTNNEIFDSILERVLGSLNELADVE